MSKEKLAALAMAVARGKADAQQLTKELISDNISVDQIFKEALVPAMEKVGEGMQEEEYAFPEVQGAIKAIQASLDLLRGTFPGGTAASAAIPQWEGGGELYEVGGHLINFVGKASGLGGYDLVLFFDECVRGLMQQIDLPCHKQAESTQKD
ncbi:MAG: B12-binding domain-containing protein [Syntrophales bacterium]|jgi:methanogenic corrinoid protein MtbC1|nr:B12-binding domain-containing protein [Syntrophales bacterium]